MEDNKILRLVYTVFLGVLLAIFVGVGINTFYPGPKSPDYPIASETYGKDPSPEQLQSQKDFNVKSQQHSKDIKPYNRNVSIITLVGAVIFLIVSLIYEKRIKIIADGVLLGGLFTLIYSIGRGFASEDNKYVFMVITVALVVVIYLGYHRFVKNINPKKTKKPTKSVASKKK